MGIPSARRGRELTGEFLFHEWEQLVGRRSQNQSSFYKLNKLQTTPGGEIPHIPGPPGWEILWLEFGVLLEEAELLQWQKFLLFPQESWKKGLVSFPCSRARDVWALPLSQGFAASWDLECPGKATLDLCCLAWNAPLLLFSTSSVPSAALGVTGSAWPVVSAGSQGLG